MSFPGGISSNTHYGRFISGLGDGGHFVGGVATLSCALDALLKDDGFTPVQNSSRNGVATMRYSAPVDPLVPVNFICYILGPNLIVQAGVELSDNGLSRKAMSCTFNLNDYLTKDSFLYNASQLCRQFRDEITLKLTANLNRALGLPERGTLSSLPHDVKFYIMGLLDVKSILSISLVNREFYLLAQDNHLWKGLVMKDYGSVQVIVNEQGYADWKKLYVLCETNKLKQHSSVVDRWHIDDNGMPYQMDDDHLSRYMYLPSHHRHFLTQFPPSPLRLPIINPFDPLDDDFDQF